MRKATFFIDGFNLYHSLDNLRDFRKYKWLNLWKFAESILLPNDNLLEVNYFTAYTDWNTDRMKRHQEYVFLNEHAGCNVTLGKFFRKDRTCMAECKTPCLGGIKRFCQKRYIAHEEKMTDVNIAVGIVRAAALKTCESIYLLSGDNDLLPALKTAMEISPDTRIRVVLPTNSKAKSIINFCINNGLKHIRIKEKHLCVSQFPDPVVVNGVTYTKPTHWV